MIKGEDEVRAKLCVYVLCSITNTQDGTASDCCQYSGALDEGVFACFLPTTPNPQKYFHFVFPCNFILHYIICSIPVCVYNTKYITC